MSKLGALQTPESMWWPRGVAGDRVVRHVVSERRWGWGRRPNTLGMVGGHVLALPGTGGVAALGTVRRDTSSGDLLSWFLINRIKLWNILVNFLSNIQWPLLYGNIILLVLFFIKMVEVNKTSYKVTGVKGEGDYLSRILIQVKNTSSCGNQSPSSECLNFRQFSEHFR